MPRRRTAAISLPDRPVAVHPLARVRLVAFEPGLLRVQEVDAVEPDRADRLDLDFAERQIALRHGLGAAVRRLEIAPAVATIRRQQLDILAPHRRVEHDAIRGAAQLLVDDVYRPLRDVQRERADAGHDVGLVVRELAARHLEVVVPVRAVVDQGLDAPIRLFVAGVEHVGDRRIRRLHDVVVVQPARGRARQRDIRAVFVDARDAEHTRADRTRRRVDRRQGHPTLNETVAEVVARDAARRVEFQRSIRGRILVHQREHATTVRRERELLALRDVVDDARLLVRHPVAERRLGRHEIVHRFLGHADARHQLPHADLALLVLLVARSREQRIFTDEHRAHVPADVRRPLVPQSALPVHLLNRKLVLQGEAVVDAFRDAFLEDVLHEPVEGRAICTHWSTPARTDGRLHVHPLVYTV